MSVTALDPYTPTIITTAIQRGTIWTSVAGHRHRVCGWLTYEPIGSELVLFQAIDGPRVGELAACSKAYFAGHYQRMEEKEGEQQP